MKPYFITLNTLGEHSQLIAVNMNTVSRIMPYTENSSCLTFLAVVGNEPAYVCVRETMEEISVKMKY